MTDAFDSPGPGKAANDSNDAFLSELARAAYAERRRREQIPGTEGLFGEPAWDILLDLFVATREGRKVPLEATCRSAAVPESVALRWIDILEKRGLVVGEGPAGDPQGRLLKLSLKGYAGLADYFRQA